MMKRYGKMLIIFGLIIFFLLIITFGFRYTDGNNRKDVLGEKEVTLNNLVGMSLEEVQEYADDNGILLEVEYRYDMNILEDVIISQDREVGTVIEEGDTIVVVVSKGEVPTSVYQEYQVNELGKVPIMMYHGIVNKKSEETSYVGGNVDKDGYNRTVEAFREDLEFYYQEGYRMIRLQDYIDGIINVELGKSPIILTFDDGNENNFKVLGEDNGELLIDPNCAVGVLEEFKKKYSDYGVTATFFVNQGLFGQDEYNEKILKWLVEHGYDVGNHTMDHVDFTKIGIDETKKQVGGLYQILDDIIPNQYVSIIALPFGSPYQMSHVNYEAILKGDYLGEVYETRAALRVGWEAEVSCFNKTFLPVFLKRIRAYDNNGEDFDIEMNFKMLKITRYISDGDKNTVVVLEQDQDLINEIANELEVIVY